MYPRAPQQEEVALRILPGVVENEGTASPPRRGSVRGMRLQLPNVPSPTLVADDVSEIGPFWFKEWLRLSTPPASKYACYKYIAPVRNANRE